MIFSAPTTPTRERLTRVVGASAWASRVGAGTVSADSAIGSSMAEPDRGLGNFPKFGPCAGAVVHILTGTGPASIGGRRDNWERRRVFGSDSDGRLGRGTELRGERGVARPDRRGY